MTKHSNGAITFEAEEIEQIFTWIANNEWAEQNFIFLIGILMGFDIVDP